MKKGDKTKNRILEATSELLSRKGYYATGLRDIMKEGEVPKGSLYHHFPNGKDEIVTNSISNISEHIKSYLQGLQESENIFFDLIDLLVQYIEGSDYCQACPLATMALETLEIQPINQAVQSSFKSWIETVREKAFKFYPRMDEDALWQIFCLIEGANLTSVVMKDTSYLQNAKKTLKLMLAAYKK